MSSAQNVPAVYFVKLAFSLSSTCLKTCVKLHSKTFVFNVSLWALKEQQHLRNESSWFGFLSTLGSDTCRLTMTEWLHLWETTKGCQPVSAEVRESELVSVVSELVSVVTKAQMYVKLTEYSCQSKQSIIHRQKCVKSWHTLFVPNNILLEFASVVNLHGQTTPHSLIHSLSLSLWFPQWFWSISTE